MTYKERVKRNGGGHFSGGCLISGKKTTNAKPWGRIMFSIFEKQQAGKCSWNRMCEEESDMRSEKGHM